MTFAERINEKADEAELLTAYANATTGASDTLLGDAVRRLVAGYGGGGGTPIALEQCTVVYEPTTDTNELVEIPLTGLTARPNIIIITSDFEDGKSARTFYGGILMNNPCELTVGSGGSHNDVYGGAAFYSMSNSLYATISTNSSVIGGASNNTFYLDSASADLISIGTPVYGGVRSYWRARHKYTITALRTH